MAGLQDNILDSGIGLIDGATVRVDICVTAEPTTYGEATTGGANSLGNKTGLTVSAIANGSIDGRQITIPAITDGSVTNTGSAGFWAITDGASILYATGTITSPQTVTSGNSFTLGLITITTREPA